MENLTLLLSPLTGLYASIMIYISPPPLPQPSSPLTDWIYIIGRVLYFFLRVALIAVFVIFMLLATAMAIVGINNYSRGTIKALVGALPFGMVPEDEVELDAEG